MCCVRTCLCALQCCEHGSECLFVSQRMQAAPICCMLRHRLHQWCNAFIASHRMVLASAASVSHPSLLDGTELLG